MPAPHLSPTAMVVIRPKRLFGPWQAGVALDFHTVASTLAGQTESGLKIFNTQRTALGELLYRLKYQQDRAASPALIAAAVGFLRRHRNKLDIIVPVPPTTARRLQPVAILSRGIGTSLDLPVVECISTERPTAPMKAMQTDNDRLQWVHKRFRLTDRRHTQDRHILVLDDLYRSGTTLAAITDILLSRGGAQSVRVLTITKARNSP